MTKTYGIIISIMIIWVFWTTSHLLGLFDEVIKNIKESTGYEIADIVVSILSVSVVFIMSMFIFKQVLTQNKQLKHDIKLNSAILLRDFDKDTKNDIKIKNSLQSLKRNSENTKFIDNDLDHLLECFEGLAIHWVEELVTDDQISEWFSSDLINMGRCRAIRDRLDITLGQKPPVYDKLDLLIKKIAKKCDVKILSSTTTSI